MKNLVKFLLIAYQLLFGSSVATCRFRPTCGRYALEAVEKHGFLKGSILAAKRVASCHPFSKRPYYDPV